MVIQPCVGRSGGLSARQVDSKEARDDAPGMQVYCVLNKKDSTAGKPQTWCINTHVVLLVLDSSTPIRCLIHRRQWVAEFYSVFGVMIECWRQRCNFTTLYMLPYSLPMTHHAVQDPTHRSVHALWRYAFMRPSNSHHRSAGQTVYRQLQVKALLLT